MRQLSNIVQIALGYCITFVYAIAVVLQGVSRGLFVRAKVTSRHERALLGREVVIVTRKEWPISNTLRKITRCTY